MLTVLTKPQMMGMRYEAHWAGPVHRKIRRRTGARNRAARTEARETSDSDCGNKQAVCNTAPPHHGPGHSLPHTQLPTAPRAEAAAPTFLPMLRARPQPRAPPGIRGPGARPARPGARLLASRPPPAAVPGTQRPAARRSPGRENGGRPAGTGRKGLPPEPGVRAGCST